MRHCCRQGEVEAGKEVWWQPSGNHPVERPGRVATGKGDGAVALLAGSLPGSLNDQCSGPPGQLFFGFAKMLWFHCWLCRVVWPVVIS